MSAEPSPFQVCGSARTASPCAARFLAHIVVERATPADEGNAVGETVRPQEEAGGTWWIDSDWNGDVPLMRRRVEAGPPASAAR